MQAQKIAHDADGNLAVVGVNGRSFVHGSILDRECAKRNAEIERLATALHDLYWWVSELPVKHPQQAEQRDRAAELLGINRRQHNSKGANANV